MLASPESTSAIAALAEEGRTEATMLLLRLAAAHSLSYPLLLPAMPAALPVLSASLVAAGGCKHAKGSEPPTARSLSKQPEEKRLLKGQRWAGSEKTPRTSACTQSLSVSGIGSTHALAGR